MSHRLTRRPFPRYAFLPGRHPHPERDNEGHGHDVGGRVAAMSADETIRWGFDLFTHGYYWEAHEAWEALWTASPRASQQRPLTKGLILLAAAGVKLRTGKSEAAARHASRSSLLLRNIEVDEADRFKALCGVAPSALADFADQVALEPEAVDADVGAAPASAPVFASLLPRSRPP
jgi:hypothetical protein